MPFFRESHNYGQRIAQIECKAMKTGIHKSIFNSHGLRYRGNWRLDKKEGYGVMDSVKRTVYEGNFQTGLRHGFGILSHKNLLNYRGEWKYGKRYGFGYGHYYDGGFYRGFWKDGKRDGYGQMWYNDGSFYDGDWKEDLHHGLGMLARSDGNRYEGAWENGVKCGKGRFFHLNHGQIQQGIWKNDWCICSFITDIPFRFTAVERSFYPLKPNCLDDYDGVYERQASNVLNYDKVNSCTTIDIYNTAK